MLGPSETSDDGFLAWAHGDMQKDPIILSVAAGGFELGLVLVIYSPSMS